MAGLEGSNLTVMVSLEGVFDGVSIGGSLSVSNSLGIGGVLGSKSLLGLDLSNLLGNLGLSGSNLLGTNDVDILGSGFGLVGDEVGFDNLLVEGNVLPLCKTIIGGINFEILSVNPRFICVVDIQVGIVS